MIVMENQIKVEVINSKFIYRDKTLYSEILDQLNTAYASGDNLFNWLLCDKLRSVCTVNIYVKTNDIEFRAASIEELISKALYYNKLFGSADEWRATKNNQVVTTICQLRDDDIICISPFSA